MENLCKTVSNRALSIGLSEVQITMRSLLLAQLIVNIIVINVISKLRERNRNISIMLGTRLINPKNVDNFKKYIQIVTFFRKCRYHEK